MSSYFDSFDSQVREISKSCKTDDQFLRELKNAETVLIRNVSYCCGDKHFPENFREKIMSLVAVYQVDPQDQTREANSWAKALKQSKLSTELHSAFHEVAAAKIQTPYGLLTDNPQENVTSRDTWAKERFERKEDK